MNIQHSKLWEWVLSGVLLSGGVLVAVTADILLISRGIYLLNAHTYLGRAPALLGATHVFINGTILLAIGLAPAVTAVALTAASFFTKKPCRYRLVKLLAWTFVPQVVAIIAATATSI